jgi:hypothetical protein
MAIALVQISSEIVTNSGVGTPSVTINVTAGSLLVAVVRVSTASVPTVSDSQGNTWTLNKAQSSVNTGDESALIFSAPNCTAGSTTITLAGTLGSSSVNCKVLEFSGAAIASPVAVSGQNTDDTTSAPNATPTPGLSIPANALGLMAFTFDRAVTGSGPTNWTLVASARSNIYWAYRVYTGATSGERGAITASVGAHYESVLVAYNAAAVPASISGNVTLDDAVAGGTLTSIASSLSGNVTLDDAVAAGTLGIAPGVITTPPLKNNTGTVLANVTGVVANVYNATTGAFVVRKTGLASSGAGVVTITDPALAPSTAYAYEIDLTVAGLGRILPLGTAA